MTREERRILNTIREFLPLKVLRENEGYLNDLTKEISATYVRREEIGEDFKYKLPGHDETVSNLEKIKTVREAPKPWIGCWV